MELATVQSQDQLELLPFGEKRRVPLLDCELSADGQNLVTCGMHSEIVVISVCKAADSAKLFQTHAPVLTHRLKGHGKPVTSVAWQSETCVISASADSTVGVFDVETGQRVRRYHGHEGIVNCVRPVDSVLLSSVGDDGWLRIWDSRVGARKGAVMSIEHKFPITSLAAAETRGIGKVWFGTLDNELHEFDLISGRATKLAVLSDGLCSLAVAEDASCLYARTFGGEISRFTRQSGAAILATSTKPNFRQKYLSRLTVGNFNGVDCCLSGEDDGTMRVISADGLLAQAPRHATGAAVTGTSFHSATGTLASCAMDGSLRLGRFSSL